MSPTDRFGRWTLVAGAALLVALGCGLCLVAFGPGQAGIRAVVRLTARTSAILFSLAFAASAINALWRGPRGRWLLRNRRYLGLSFAVSHAFHLAALVALANLLRDPWLLRTSDLGGLLGGGFGYLMLALMSATSFDGAVTWLGRRRWKILHTFGMYVLGVIFVFTFLGAALQTHSPVRFFFVALVLTPFGLRLAAFGQRRALSSAQRVPARPSPPAQPGPAAPPDR